ncbi:CDP-diacylglycerol--serine O-phosphatidyltransferase [Maridesulfovibrio hydrothermalis]|uniref:CDP-diacylglycerol--serine O-phosphatidyltransferase n=1 Tax=Maridesulfovibrio hydrothermalis AM13 = DSM 14728 TaxID=1121451 RepID=L0RBQ8_9BACT|nr:CDP-diacylglycerol--serine O-phosphatidyltransferase [Maridesulfovibrio hydrothermalis]CCO24194.1 CDP-diacylglycerol/serine O-phosphatidyltransferase [Maridesulfovibrio hydrothermalis AM13 = DSM 14728]
MTKEKRIPKHKGVYILPNLVTVSSLFCGFLAMNWVVEGQYEMSAVAILVSCLLDGLDGKVARLTGTSSEFGVQLDSLADVVAFGVTPAFMVYHWQLQQFGRLGMLAAFLLIACGALRLARFNVQTATTPKAHFIGLPIPAAGCTLATLILFAPYIPENIAQSVLPMFTLVLVYCLSFLMVSSVRYNSFKEIGMFKAHPFSSMVTVIALFAMVASQPKFLGFIIFAGYIISGPIYTVFILSRRSNKLLGKSSKELS